MFTSRQFRLLGTVALISTLAASMGGCDDRRNSTTTTPTGTNSTGTSTTGTTGTAGGTTSGTTTGSTNRVDPSRTNGTTGTTGTTGSTTGTNPTNAKPDNTAVNERDRNPSNPTPMDQGESEADRKITAEIRRAVVGAAGLSINAQNCKIITRGGVVTLRGPVASQAEKETIERQARAAAGVTSVVNELEVSAR